MPGGPIPQPGGSLACRRSIRLQGYDYSAIGAYFVTVVTDGRACLLAHALADTVIPTEIGIMVARTWEALALRFPLVLDAFVVMPNHVHGILAMRAPSMDCGPGVGSGESGTAASRPALGRVVGAFKSLTTVEYVRAIGRNGGPRRQRLWQRNYYEHIIRNDGELDAVREYITGNPLKWCEDGYNPNR